MELRSNASYAENGLHLPMYLVHGTLDRPTANSQVLVDRYAALRYDALVEWPPLGHNVWSQTYADGRIIPHFLRYQRDPAPRRVRFRGPNCSENGTIVPATTDMVKRGVHNHAHRFQKHRRPAGSQTAGCSRDQPSCSRCILSARRLGHWPRTSCQDRVRSSLCG